MISHDGELRNCEGITYIPVCTSGSICAISSNANYTGRSEMRWKFSRSVPRKHGCDVLDLLHIFRRGRTKTLGVAVTERVHNLFTTHWLPCPGKRYVCINCPLCVSPRAWQRGSETVFPCRSRTASTAIQGQPVRRTRPFPGECFLGRRSPYLRESSSCSGTNQQRTAKLSEPAAHDHARQLTCRCGLALCLGARRAERGAP